MALQEPLPSASMLPASSITFNSNDIDTIALPISAPETAIQEAEQLFTLCHFSQALNLANEIIRAIRNVPPKNPYGNMIDETISDIDYTLHIPLPIPAFSINILNKNDDNTALPHAHFDHQPQKPQNNQHITNSANENPHRLLQLRVCIVPQRLMDHNKSNNTSDNDVSRKNWIRDRAAAIVIQSSYELWKERCDRSCNHRFRSPSEENYENNVISRNKEEKRLIEDLNTFFEIYHNYGVRRGVVMSWELAILWIRFCVVVECCSSIADIISFLSEMERGLIQWEKENCHNHDSDDDKQNQQRQYPIIHQLRQADDDNDNVDEFHLPLKVLIAEEIEDCLLLKEDIIMMEEKRTKKENVNEQERKTKGERKEGDNAKGGCHQNTIYIFGGSLQGGDIFMDCLWTGDDRWINRGKIVAASFILYSAWRRQRHVLTTGKMIGSFMISPFREVWEAF